jgi:hypothetical protein
MYLHKLFLASNLLINSFLCDCIWTPITLHFHVTYLQMLFLDLHLSFNSHLCKRIQTRIIYIKLASYKKILLQNKISPPQNQTQTNKLYTIQYDSKAGRSSWQERFPSKL